MSTAKIKTALMNLLLLALVATPIFFFLVWAQGLITGAEGSTEVGYVLTTGAVYYLNNLIPILIGGLVHQIVWVCLPQGWSSSKTRAVALVLAPVIPVAVWVAWGGPARSLLHFVVPMALALLVYVFLMRTPGYAHSPSTA